MNSRNSQQPQVELVESTYRGIPSIQDIMNSVHPGWDGSVTLQSARDIINHRNMLLRAFWPAEDLISTTSLEAADQVVPIADPGYCIQLYAILPVPGQPYVHRRIIMGLLCSATTPSPSSVSYRDSNPGNSSYGSAR